MNIADLLIQSPSNTSPIRDEDFMKIWEEVLEKNGFCMRHKLERNSLTDATIAPLSPSSFVGETPVHIKVIGRHMNGSFRCHIGTGKASRPIRSTELCQQMRLLAVFFKAEGSRSQLILPDFILFPTWLLHLFRYTQHGSSPGRTDVRFLENAALAKEDHIYRLNHVLNTLFRFNLRSFDQQQLRSALELANYLFDTAGLEHENLPRPVFSPSSTQPALYATLISLLHAPRPSKIKPMCHNCSTKPASRRHLCVACYRYQLKHAAPRPLRLIVANRPGPRVSKTQSDLAFPTGDSHSLPMVFYSPKSASSLSRKHCANCGVQETHQWYRNLCGTGHWCETCKSYYLRHTKVRPAELFVKAAKRKVDVRTLVNWTASEDTIGGLDSRRSSSSIESNMPPSPVHARSRSGSAASSGCSSPTASLFVSMPLTPPDSGRVFSSPCRLPPPHLTQNHHALVPPFSAWTSE
ncbi:hypothetical protein CLU79DRAFT_782159 [Phycomyces nitens]|nr:hypothetical protein CLU79DRAFT_782159 [Phycomyces nitens]